MQVNLVGNTIKKIKESKIKNNFSKDSLNSAVDTRNKSAFDKNQSVCVGVDSKTQKQTFKNHI